MADIFLVSVARQEDSKKEVKDLASEEFNSDEKKTVPEKERRRSSRKRARVKFDVRVSVENDISRSPSKGSQTSSVFLPLLDSESSSNSMPPTDYPRLNSVPSLAHRPGLVEFEPVDHFRIGEVVGILVSCGKKKRRVYVPALVNDFTTNKGVTFYNIQVPKYQLWKCEEFYQDVTVPRLRRPRYFESKMFLLNEFRAGDKVKTIVKKKGSKSLLFQGTIGRQNSDHSYDIIVPNFAKLNLKPEMRIPIESIQLLGVGKSAIPQMSADPRTSELPDRDLPLFSSPKSTNKRTNISSFLACSFQVSNLQRVDLFSSPNPYIVVYLKHLNSNCGIIPMGVTEWIRSSQHPQFRTEIVVPYIATNPGCIFIDIRHHSTGLKSVRKRDHLLASGELNLLSLKENNVVTLELNPSGQEPDGRKEPTILTVAAMPITPGNVKTLSSFSPTPPKLEKDDKLCVRMRGIAMKRKFVPGNGFELREVPRVNTLAEKDPLLRWLDDYEEKLDTVFIYSEYTEEPEQATAKSQLRLKGVQSEWNIYASQEKESDLSITKNESSIDLNYRKPQRAVIRRKDVVSWLLLSWSKLMANLYILSGTDRRRVFDVLINIISREEFDLANELFTYENLRTYLSLLKELCLEAFQLLKWSDDTDRRFCSEVFVICYFRLPGFRYTILEVFGIPGDLDEKEQELWQEHRLQVSAWLTHILKRDQMMLFSAIDNPSLFPGMWDRSYLRDKSRNFTNRKTAFLSTGEQVVIEKVRGKAVVVRIPFEEKKANVSELTLPTSRSGSRRTVMFGVSMDGLQKHMPITAYDEDLQSGLLELQSSIRDNQKWKIEFFHAFVKTIQRQRHGRLHIADIEGAYEIIGTITAYFLYVGQTWWKSSRVEIVDAVAEAIGAHNVLLSPFMKAVWIKTNVRKVAHVNTALVVIDRWLERSRTVMDTQLPETFDYRFFWKGLSILLDQEHFGILAKTLNLIYSHMDIFRESFRLYILDYLLEGSRFVKYFLHWAPIVRNFYFSILAYKINRCGCGHYMPMQKSFQRIVKLVKEGNEEQKEQIIRRISKRRSSKLRRGDSGRKPLAKLTQDVRDMMMKIHRENTRWFVSDLKKSQCDIFETSMTATKKQNDLKALTVLRLHITEILEVYENNGGPFVPDVQNALIPVALKQFSEVCDVAQKVQQYYTVKETPNDRRTIGYSVCPRLQYALQVDPLKQKNNIDKFMN